MRRYSNTAVETTLDGGISDSATTVVLASATGWPTLATGERVTFRIGTEIIEAGARSGVTLSSCTRGVDGTTAAAHSTGAAVRHVASADELTSGGLELRSSMLVLPGFSFGSATTNTINAASIFYSPMQMQRAGRITGLYGEITTAAAAGTRLKLLLYRCLPDWSVGALLAESGHIAADAIAVVSLTGLNVAAPRGATFWTAVWVEGAPIMRAYRGTLLSASVAATMGATPIIRIYRAGSVTYGGAAASPGPAITVTTLGVGIDAHVIPKIED
jgi:hypothetical protein